MSLTKTTIVGNINAFDTTLQVASATGFVVGQPVRVGNEYMKVQVIVGTMIGVFRGIHGTKAVAHNALADAITGLNTDFPIEMFPYAKGSYTYSVDGALTVAPGIHKLGSASAMTMTLAAPTTAQEGLVMVILALTSATSHTVTYTPGFGGLGASFDVATLATVGDTLTIMAISGLWVMIGNNGTDIG
jgi:hypothetical protein